MIGERLGWRVEQIWSGVANAFIHSKSEWVRQICAHSDTCPSRFPHIISFFADLSQVLQIHSIQYGHSTAQVKKGLKPLETPLFEFAEAEVSHRLWVVSVKSRGCVPDSGAATIKIHKIFCKCFTWKISPTTPTQWIHWLLSSREKFSIRHLALFLGTLVPLTSLSSSHDHCLLMLAPVSVKLLCGKHAWVEAWRLLSPDSCSLCNLSSSPSKLS